MKGLAPALVLIAPISLVLTATVALPTNNNQTLRAIPELVGERYCYGDAEVFSVWLKLRVKYLNATEKTLILDKEIGKAWYGLKVARSLDDLENGRYEYNPNIDWFFSDKDQLHDRPSVNSPGPDFAILNPGQAFEGEIETAVVAQYESPRILADSIRPGVHVFQMDLSAWNHPGEASGFGKSWQRIGQLVTGVVKTDPLEIRIPVNPKVEKKCK